METRQVNDGRRTAIISGVTRSLPCMWATLGSLAVTKAFTHFALIGSDEEALEAVATTIRTEAPTSTIITRQVELLSNESWGIAAHELRQQIGAWDLFVHCSDGFSHVPAPLTTIRGADEDLWWGHFERNVRSLHLIARHFLPKMRKVAMLVNICIVGTADSQTGRVERSSAKVASAAAASEVLEYLRDETVGLKIYMRSFEDSHHDLFNEYPWSLNW